MNKIFNFVLLFFLLFILSCAYKPILNKKNYLENEKIDYVIQINGKKRTIINAEKDLKEGDILNIAKNEKLLDKYLNKKSIKKVIFVKNRLINILANE